MSSIRRASRPSITHREIEKAYLGTAPETISDVIANHRTSESSIEA